MRNYQLVRRDSTPWSYIDIFPHGNSAVVNAVRAMLVEKQKALEMRIITELRS